MRSQVWPRMVPTGDHSRFLPQAHIANSPVAMTARITMKLQTLLPGVGALAFRFPTKPDDDEKKKIQRDLMANVERIMVKHGADARQKNKKMIRDGARGDLIGVRKKEGKKIQAEKRAAIQQQDKIANEKKRWQAMTPFEQYQELFKGE